MYEPVHAEDAVFIEVKRVVLLDIHDEEEPSGGIAPQRRILELGAGEARRVLCNEVLDDLRRSPDLLGDERVVCTGRPLLFFMEAGVVLDLGRGSGRVYPKALCGVTEKCVPRLAKRADLLVLEYLALHRDQDHHLVVLLDAQAHSAPPSVCGERY